VPIRDKTEGDSGRRSKYSFIKEKLRAQIFIFIRKSIRYSSVSRKEKRKKVLNWKEKKKEADVDWTGGNQKKFGRLEKKTGNLKK
jgi:hypothetical protein